ncbi:MAG: hypothetical protein AB1625_12385 [Acidobacteriota bacterium]
MAERVRVGVLVPNLFTRVPVEGAVRAAGAEPVAVAAPAGARGFPVLIVDLDAVGDDPLPWLFDLVESGCAVLAFGPHVEGNRLALARRAGAVVLPRGAFLQKLPELLAAALRGAR